MENNKIIKITITIMIVSTLLLIGYFLMSNPKENLKQEIFLDLGNIRGINESYILVELAPVEDQCLTDNCITRIGVQINEETIFVRMPIDTWFYEEFTENDEAYSVFDNLKEGSLIAIYVEEDNLNLDFPYATKIILLDYPQAPVETNESEIAG